MDGGIDGVGDRAGVSASGVGARLAVLEIRRKMVGHRPAWLGRRAQSRYRVAQRPPQSWNNDFYNALQQYDWAEFWRQFAIFGMIAFAMIVVRRLFTLSATDPAYPLAALADRPLSAQLARRPGLLPHAAQPDDNRQPGSAHRRRPRQLYDDNVRPVARAAECIRHAGLVPFILWALSGALTIPLGGGAHITIPGYLVFAALIYAVGGTLLTRWIGHPLVRLSFRPAALRSRFPLQPGAAARKCRERRFLRRRGPRARYVPDPLRADRRQLVGHHHAGARS